MGPDQEVIFDGEQITMDIPQAGIVLENGWAITPLIYPEVRVLQQAKTVRKSVYKLHSCDVKLPRVIRYLF